MAREYVTVTVEKFTGPNVHPDDTTLLGRIFNVTIWSWGNEQHLADFIQARAGRLGFDSDKRVATVTATPKELKQIRSAGSYRGAQ